MGPFSHPQQPHTQPLQTFYVVGCDGCGQWYQKITYSPLTCVYLYICALVWWSDHPKYVIEVVIIRRWFALGAVFFMTPATKYIFNHTFFTQYKFKYTNFTQGSSLYMLLHTPQIVYPALRRCLRHPWLSTPLWGMQTHMCFLGLIWIKAFFNFINGFRELLVCRIREEITRENL